MPCTANQTYTSLLFSVCSICPSLSCPVLSLAPVSPYSRCERLLCNQTSECLASPLRITYYHLTFPTNIPVPTNVFRMGPSNTVPGDHVQIAIIGGNKGDFFSMQRVPSGGEMAVTRPITEPQDFELSLEMRLLRYGTTSTYLAKVRVFVVQEHPVMPFQSRE